MPLVQRSQGDYIQADFFNLTGGLNNTDSPFKVQNEQAIDGYNYEYIQTGGIKKRNGNTRLNASADAALRTLGLYLHSTAANVKTLLRAADTKLQTINTTTGVSTNLASDATGASTTAFSTTQPVVFSQFNTPSASTTWLAGGGAGSGVVLGYNGTKFTQNGVAVPTGSIGLSVAGADGTIPAGTYYYAVAFHKLSTGAISNAVLDKSVVIGATNHVVVDLTTLTSVDTTKYDLVYIYRSNIAGASGFTVGDLAGTVASSATSFTDTGAVQLTASNIPRANNTVLDNSVLLAGTYNTLTTFKRRLVTAQGSTIYLSDVNKPESWPTGNTLTVPSGGDIKAIGVIYFSTPTTSATDEYLVIFKEREMWVVTGSSISDWQLKFIDYVGCVAQPTVVFANGFLYWIDYRGIYMWDGSSKPIYISRLIEFDFGSDGDIDKANLTLACGAFYRKQNEVVWYVPSLSLGIQYLSLKLDLRLTLSSPSLPAAIMGRILEGAFIKDSLTYPIYACASALPTYNEVFYGGGGTDGFIWKLLDNPNSDNGAGIAFRYRTKTEDFGLVGTAKRFHKVVVWCRESSTANLTLNYWTTYRLDSVSMGNNSLPITNQVTNGVWDQATWDNAYWDLNLISYTNNLVFNLNGLEGDALTLEFKQVDPNSPLTIAGYSIIYSIAGMRK